MGCGLYTLGEGSKTLIFQLAIICSFQDQIRISKKAVDPEKPQLGLIDRWYHTACFVSSREELVFKPEYSAAQLKGFITLRAEDKEELKKRLPAVKSEG